MFRYSQTFGDCTEGDDNYLDDISCFKKVTNVDFRDRRLIDTLNDPNSVMHNEIKDCLFMIACCHTIVTDSKDGEVIYNASSPDELALVNFTKFCGVEYMGTDENNIIKVTHQGKDHHFELLEVFEFTSARKRQSCLVRTVNNQEIWLYTKGADSVLLETFRLNKDSPYNNKEKIDQLNENLKEYGKIGLRTLVLAKRQVPLSEFLEWNKKYQLANRTLEGREEKLQTLQDELEKNFEIIGATAIEDKLQQNVGMTIEALKKAGIKLWVLTGDKIETAINIGYSSMLLNNETIQHIIDEKEEVPPPFFIYFFFIGFIAAAFERGRIGNIGKAKRNARVGYFRRVPIAHSKAQHINAHNADQRLLHGGAVLQGLSLSEARCR